MARRQEVRALPIVTPSTFLYQLFCVLLLTSTVLQAQVLARPGWAGSGVAPEPWWQRAVFYRLDPERFQDSDGDGRGDLAGVAERLDYLQSLGIDALLLDSSGPLPSSEEVGDLVRAASQHHLRVLITISPTLYARPQAELLAVARSWLSSGAAGVWAPRPEIAGGPSPYTQVTTALRQAVSSYPGERVLLSDPIPLQMAPSTGAAAPAPVAAMHVRGRSGRVRRRRSRARPPVGQAELSLARAGSASREGVAPTEWQTGRGNLLTTTALLVPGNLPELRSALSSQESADPAAHALLQFAHPPSTGSPDAAADAALLLGSRGAVILDFGEELGLALYGSPGSAAATEAMQWTPSNHTPAAAQGAAVAPKAAEPEFGAYHPYRPPPRALTAPLADPVHVVADPNIPEAPPAPDTLLAFTSSDGSGEHSLRIHVDALENVIVEDRDPRSLLNLYRQLIALHHSNPSLRNGALRVVSAEPGSVIAWVRRTPVGVRTTPEILGAVNLSDSPVTFSLDAVLQATGFHTGAVRPLFTAAPAALLGETTSRLLLPPHAALLAEPVTGGFGGRSEEAIRRRRGRRRR